MEQKLHSNVAIKTSIRSFITENFFFGVETFQYDDKDSLMEKGILDSTGVLEMIVFLESEYSITIEDDELRPENLDSLDNLEAFITRKLEA